MWRRAKRQTGGEPMNYTKGTWTILRHGLTYQIYCGKYRVAAGIYNKNNAHLIASAPDMHEALKALNAKASGKRNAE